LRGADGAVCLAWKRRLERPPATVQPLTSIAPSPVDLEERLDRARETPVPGHELVDALNELSWAVRQKEPQRSLELATEARARARELAYQEGLGWALRTSGHAHYRLAEYAAALADSLEALAIFEHLELAAGRASAAGGVGMAYTRLADYKLGLRYHRESLRIRREMGDSVGEGASLNNLGVILFELADYPAALEHYLASLDIWKRLEHRDGVGHAFNNLGEVYEKMGDLDRALECYDLALEPFEEVGNGVGAGATRVNRARVLLDRGDGEGAIDVLERCLERARGAGDRWNEAACHPLMGRALLLLGRTDLAEAHFKEGLAALGELGLRYPEAEALLFLADLRLEYGRYREAGAHLYRVLRIARETGSNALRYRAHRALSQLHESRGHPRRALRHFRLYDRWKEKVLGGEADRRLNSILIRAEAQQAEREAEIQRLRHVDLAAAVARLEEADAEKARLVAELQARAQELERMAREDALTGVANRRAMTERLEAEYVRAFRFERDLTAVMVDADRFKMVNDDYSHGVGDEVLRRVARVLSESCRAVDAVGRWGGEEFLILLVEAPPAGAASVCEKIRLAVERHPWHEVAPGLEVTVSIGHAALAPDMDSPEALVAAADAALYRAKASGRNCIRGQGVNFSSTGTTPRRREGA
jgi:diguanylate cyclase (GGDEF)-like protein